MRSKAKRTLSLLLVLSLIVSLFAGLTVTAAAASQTVTVQLTDKAGETKTLATWEYDSANRTYQDAATGKELSIVTDYSAAPLVYTGLNKKPDPRCLSVTVKGIALEDLFEYASELADGIDLRGDTAMYLADAGGYEDEFTYDQYWGLTRYHYMSWYNADSYAAASEDNYADGVEVPATLAIIGYHSARVNDGVKTAAGLAEAADAKNALRISVGMQQNGNRQIADSWVHTGNNSGAGDINEGNLSVKEIATIRFTPVYRDFTVVAGHAVVTTADGYTKAAAGETVSFTIAAEEGYAVKSVSVKQGETAIRVTEESGTYRFSMPEAVEGGAVTVAVETEESGTAPAWNGSSIGSAEDFTAFAEAVNGGEDFAGKTVTLSADVDLSSVADWTPVGTENHPFAGTFDGAGKTVSGLTITDVDGGYHGLFGYLTGTAKDFTLAGSIESDKPADFVGGVAGFNAGTISGVTSSVVINVVKGYNVGGIAGLNTSGVWVDVGTGSDVTKTIDGATGLIENCANTGAVTGYQKVGGIVGENAGSVNACYNTAKVDAANNSSKNGVGGIAGRNGNNNTATEVGVISNCYNTGAVGRSGQKWTGGIAGFNNSKSAIKNCYNTGEIVSTTGYSNPIAGNQEGSRNTVNNYSLTGLSYTGSSAAERGTVKTADEMKVAEFVTALCGDGRAFVAKTDDYPILRWQAGADSATVTALVIESDPDKLTYVKGERFDASGLKIKASWSDGTSEYVTDYTVDKAGALMESGNVKISASYGGQTAEKSYAVTVISVTKIEITTPPNTTEYVAGQKFSSTGMVVTVSYSNGSSRTLTSKEYSCAPDTALTGTETEITVTYTAPDNSACTAAQPITFIPRTLTKITISSRPDNQYYAADEAFDPTGMGIKAYFNDKPTTGVTLSEKTAENQDGYTWTLGEDKKTVTVSYTFGGKTETAGFEITRSASNAPALADGAYRLGSTDDLSWFANKVNTGSNQINGLLTADVTLPDGWPGLGTKTLKPYAGTFDGNGKTITINMQKATGFDGFVGYLGGTIRNLTIDGQVMTTAAPAAVFACRVYGAATIENCVNKANMTVEATSSKNSVGAFVGSASSGNSLAISGCVNEGSISGPIQCAGGIVGRINTKNVKITNCANTGSIAGTHASLSYTIGGIVGEAAQGAEISGCYNSGAVAGRNGIGGIVGGGPTSGAYTLSISDCYNTGAVSADLQPGSTTRGVGGIVGGIGKSAGAVTLTNCYSAAAVSGGEADALSGYLGGLIGYVGSAGHTISNSFYPAGGTAYNAAAGVTVAAEAVAGKTADEMKAAEFVALLGEAFATDGSALNGGYAILRWQTPSAPVKPDPTPDPTPGGDVGAPVWDGRSIDLTWYDPAATSLYISTPAQLAGLAAIVNGIYNAEIDTFAGDKSHIVDNVSTGGETGGNNQATSTYHYGADNFAGKTVYLTADIDMGTANYMPIGGQYLMAKNNSSTRIDASFCGVFDGQGHSVTLHADRHCSNGNYGDGQSVGLIGRLGVHDNEDAQKPTGATVRNVAVYGSVYANRSVGGVVGKTGRGSDTLIEGCANFATVKATDSKGVGGVVGSAWNAPTIRSCYNAGAVETTYSTGMTGGIAGSSEATIVNCFNVGAITGPAGNKTSAIASDNGGSSFENCYWLSGSADMGVYNKTPDSVAEKSAAEMKNADFLALLGNDFAADSDGVNGGYPVLRWQSSGTPVEPGQPGQTGGETEPELPFTDAAGHWAAEAIRFVYENELFRGVSDTEFAPDATMTRGMLVTVLYRLAGQPEAAAAGFVDVAAEAWYARAVAWAAENGIVLGYGDSFGPNDLVTREQMAVILMRYAALRGLSSGDAAAIEGFADAGEISDWAAAALAWAHAEGLILGRTETTIVPHGNATRAEVATILMRFVEKLAEK